MSIFCIFLTSYFGFLITFNLCWIKNIQYWRIIALIPHLTCNVSCTMYHGIPVACRRSPVICHLSLMPKATATDPPPANSPTMHSRMVGKDQKNQNKTQSKQKREEKKHAKSKFLGVGQIYGYALWPEVSSPPGSGACKHGQTDRQTGHGYRNL